MAIIRKQECSSVESYIRSRSRSRGKHWREKMDHTKVLIFSCFSAVIFWIPLLSGCATSAFSHHGNTKESSAEIAKEVIAKEEIAKEEIAKEGDVTDVSAPKSTLDYIPGQHIAENIPYVNTLPWIGAPDKNEKVAQAHFTEAETQFSDKKYHEARTSYEKAGNYAPDSALHEDTLFMVAETHFFEDNYPEAFEAYENLLANYKRSRHMDVAVARQFAIGQYWQSRQQENPEFILTPNMIDKTRPFNDLQGSALRAFEKVRLNHPTGSLADDSLMATAGVDFLRKHYQDADYHYSLVRREYPNSEHQYQAHLLGIQSKIRCYQGPRYDGTCLKEAKELIKQTFRQFPKMSDEDRERLQKLYSQVETNLAMRDYEVGNFYAKKGYSNAARLYYDRVIDGYSHTAVAAKAREELENLQGKPNTPPQRLEFISSMFPDVREDPLFFTSGSEVETGSQ